MLIEILCRDPKVDVRSRRARRPLGHLAPDPVIGERSPKPKGCAGRQILSGSGVFPNDATPASMPAGRRQVPDGLDETAVLRALCLGDLDFVEAAMAVLCDMGAADVWAALHGEGAADGQGAANGQDEVGLAGLWRRAGFDGDCLPAARIAMEIVIQACAEAGDRGASIRRDMHDDPHGDPHAGMHGAMPNSGFRRRVQERILTSFEQAFDSVVRLDPETADFLMRHFLDRPAGDGRLRVVAG